MYFIGNVLDSHQQAARHPEAGKEHFHITPREAQDMDATGLPVHLEHANNVKVGEVMRSWNDHDGKKWVLAKVDTDTIEGKFVRNDLSSKAPVYGSLSLQHIYNQYTDGSSSKHPVEVSICKEPRRPGCKIVHASLASAPSVHDVYKGNGTKERIMASTPTDAPQTSTEPASMETTSTAPEEPSTTQLMKEVVEASQKNVELQKELDEKTAALAEIERAKKETEELELQKQTQLAQELGDAVLEHVAKLDPSLANQDTEQAIGTLRDKYPSEVSRLLEVACCASKHAAKLEAQLVKQKEETERKLMEQRYHAAVAERPGCHGSSEPAVQSEQAVPASKRHKTNGNPYMFNMAQTAASAGSSQYGQQDTMAQIHAAYRNLHGRGSTTDAMKAVANIIPQQRASGFR